MLVLICGLALGYLTMSRMGAESNSLINLGLLLFDPFPYFIGKVNEKRAPLLTPFEAAKISPLWARTQIFAIVRPIPVPPADFP